MSTGAGGELHARKLRRRWLLVGLSLLALAALVDPLLQHTLLASGSFGGRRIAPYDPPLFNDHQQRLAAMLASHLATGDPPAETFRHDPELGWCPQPGATIRDQHYDWAGARVGAGPLARERAPGVRRVVTVGCSFTLGTEVGDAESWAALLDEARADLEVANLGVEGYGIDQALLRYRRDGRPLQPNELWLGFLPSAILRATTLYRPAQMHWASVGLFKPRFVVEQDGSLRLVPNPGASLERTQHLLTHQADFVAALVADDPWVRRVPAAWAPRDSSLLHRSAFARLALTAFEAGGRAPFAVLADEKSEARRLARAIALAFHREAAAEGARFRLVILPSKEELAHWHENERASWLDLADELRREGVEVIDLTPEFPAPDAPGWDGLWASGGHYSVAGNRLVAEQLERRCD